MSNMRITMPTFGVVLARFDDEVDVAVMRGWAQWPAAMEPVSM